MKPRAHPSAGILNAPSLPRLIFPLLLGVGFGCDGTTGLGATQVVSVTVTPSSSSIEIGSTLQLPAQVLNSIGALLTTPATWSTSDALVASSDVGPARVFAEVGINGADLPALQVHCDGPTDGRNCTLSVVRVPDLPDVRCADGSARDICPSAGQDFFGQDGNYSINPESYTHFSAGDERLAEAVTGLTWATTAFLADGFSDATAACSALNSAMHGGETDWRVPSLRDLGRTFSSRGVVDVWPGHMDNPRNSVWWSSTVDNSDRSRMIGFSGNWPSTYRMPRGGGVGQFQGARYTFCVSGPEMAGAWEVNADAVTVTHTTTGLMWHRSPSVNQTMGWSEALKYCENSLVAGYSDWRLPTLREYVSVFDLDTHTGYMSDAFGPEPTVKMLTGTPNAVGGGSAYIGWIREDLGALDLDDLTTLVGGARCVRGRR